MSGPTWLPPKTLGSPERAAPPMSQGGPSFYRAQKNALADPRSKYGAYEHNGGTGAPSRYFATGPTDGMMQHPEEPGSAAFRPLSPKSADHYYTPSHPHLPGYDHQSNEVGGSNNMEKEGLTRSLSLLESCGVNIDCIVTDRHPQVQKFLRERNITHYYDVWHFAKGISKKLEAISKQKDCEKLKKWMKSINNHIYWTAAGSTSGPERIAKWAAILNHVRDVHTHEDPLYPKCEHAIRKTTDKSKWLQAVFYKLEKAMTNKRTLKDVAKLSPHHQTSSLEAFHAVILHFAPKNVVFPFIGMLCRLYLAAMHYNENANRPQAQTAEGVPLFKISFPKSRKGECRVKPQKTQPTFGYVTVLMDLIFEEVLVNSTPYTDALLTIHVPEDLSAQFEKPDKEEVIANFVSSFTRGAV
ncbi:hypothetical protein ACEWY4_025542 [Coilia grayii]|uniref:Uncharacterized protein n=1 Tax=Coilia grayii TaxID=363190 RepID=A0ABD1IXW0_9TELE